MDFTPEDERLIKENGRNCFSRAPKFVKTTKTGNSSNALFPGERGARRRAPPFGRAIPAASHRCGQDRRGRNRTRRQIGRRRPAARRCGGYGVHGRRYGAHLRAQDRQDGRWAYEDVGRIQCRYFGAGGVFPQSPAHAFGRRAGDPDQNRRPPAQHAHSGVDADQQTDQNHGRNALPVRTAGVSARPVHY